MNLLEGSFLIKFHREMDILPNEKELFALFVRNFGFFACFHCMPGSTKFGNRITNRYR